MLMISQVTSWFISNQDEQLILFAHHLRRKVIKDWFKRMMDEDDEKFSDSDGFIGCLVVCMCIFIVLGSVAWAILLIK